MTKKPKEIKSTKHQRKTDDVIKSHKEKIITIISALFPKTKIYLYGSRARGTHQEWSDIDLALDAGKKLNRHDIREVMDMLEASNIPYKVSIVDFNDADKEFKDEISKDMMLWN